MKKIKKKICSLISSLLVPTSFVSTSSKFKAFDEDEYVVYKDAKKFEDDKDAKKFEDDKEDPENEDEEISEEDTDYDDIAYENYGLQAGLTDEILNYVKSHPWKTAGWLSLFLLTKNTVSGIYDTLCSPSGKTWDEITNELITKHLANKQENQSKEFDKIKDKDKIITIINILKDISNRMSRGCESLGPIDTTQLAVRNVPDAIKDILYYNFRGNYQQNEETVVRKAKDRKNWMCYHVAITLKKCCDKLGLKSTLYMNYTGHVCLLVKSPCTFSYKDNTKNALYRFYKGNVCSFHGINGKCFESEKSYSVFGSEKTRNYYNTDIIYGKNNKCYRLIDDPNNDDIHKAKKVFEVDKNSFRGETQAEKNKRAIESRKLQKKKNDLISTIIEGNELAIAQNTNIKELPLRTKPLNYTPPASYIDMLRQP